MDENQRREEFARVWLQAEPSVSAYVFASIMGFHDAEDVIQQVTQSLARRFNEYDPGRPVVGWALWVAKSRVIDFYRTQGRNQVVFSDALLQRLADTIAEQSEGSSRRREALEICLDELPKNSRRLLDLRYVDELSAADVAQTIGSTGESLRVRADSTGRGGRVDSPPPLGTGEFTLAVFVYLGTPSHEGTVATNIRGDEGNFTLSLDENGRLQATIRGIDGDAVRRLRYCAPSCDVAKRCHDGGRWKVADLRGRPTVGIVAV